MTDNSSLPVDLRIKRKRDNPSEEKISTKKKSRHQECEIPLDLSVKSNYTQPSLPFPISTPILPLYHPTNVFFNSSALLYDLFLANLNSYCQQQQQQQYQQQQQHHHHHQQQSPRLKVESKSNKQQSNASSRLTKENSTTMTAKHESYACSCGERYSNVAQLVSHLKMTNHSAQLSSTHDEVAKLVRGQDIWLSRDTNPANQILKCLRCSLSFETLPDLTAHMMKTNHFTQLLPSSSSTSSSANSYQHSNAKQQQQHSPTKFSNNQSRSTCLVCSQQFAREVDLVDHLQRLHQIRYNCTTCGMYFENESIYKEHLLKEMHHRNGKTNRNREYFLNQSKTIQQRSINDTKSEQNKSHCSIDEEVERLILDLLDEIVAKEKSTSNNNSNNPLSLLQNFVIEQIPSNTFSADTFNRHIPIDLNNNCDDNNDDEESNPSTIHSTDEKLSTIEQTTTTTTNSNESPLVSLQKMLAYPSSNMESSLPLMNDHRIKKKKFDKYRLFAEKMLRSTLS